MKMSTAKAILMICAILITAAPLQAGMNNHGGCPHEQNNMGDHESMSHSSHGQNMDHGQDMADRDHGKDISNMGRGQSMSGMEHAADRHSGGMGQAIRETRVNDHHLQYRLIDMQQQMAGMENKPDISASHHLMVYVSRPDGTAVKDAKVGYMVTLPDQKTQKTMAMGMGGGYGADITLPESKSATVKVKAVVDDQTLIDTFTYPVEQ